MRVSIVGLLLVLATPLPAQTPASAPSPIASTSERAAPTMLKPAPNDRTQPRTRFVTTYGSDPCPKSDDPDEIVVCTNRPDEERFRVPQAVRSDTGRPVGPNERNRKNLEGDGTGGAGGSIGSCSAVGSGGASGCNLQMQDQYRAAKKAGEVPRLP